MAGLIGRFKRALVRLRKSQDVLSISHIRIQNISVMFTFPLTVMCFCWLLFSSNPDFSLLGLAAMPLAGLSFCVGCMCGVFTPKTAISKVFRFSLVLASVCYALSFLLPEGLQKTLASSLTFMGLGVAAASSFYSFSVILNNTERFAGLLPICIAANWGYLINNQNAQRLGPFFHILFLCALIGILLFSRKLKFECDTAKEESGPAADGSNWLLLYATAFVTVNYIANGHISALGAFFTPLKLLAGIVTMGFAVLLQLAFQKTVWHMWNAILFYIIVGVALLWMPSATADTVGCFVLEMVNTLYLFTLFYTLSGIIKRGFAYRFFQTFMKKLYVGLILAAALGGTLAAAYPDHTLTLLTVSSGAVVLLITLLTPMVSQKLFLTRWMESYRTVDILTEEEINATIERRKKPQYPRLEDTKLMPREKQVVTLLLQGMTLRQIAPELGIAYDTARTYGRDAYRKLNVNSRTELFLYFGVMPSEKKVNAEDQNSKM